MSQKKLLKRIFDIFFSLSALLIIAPILLLSIILIIFSSPGSAIFRQKRIGLEGEIFEIFKLRTMYINPERVIKQTTLDDSEVFPVGRILRRFKIDELPQIINVLLGHMSVVGPRPCLEQTFYEMPGWAKARTKVKPGITGLAQINGNVTLKWEERWRYDIEYADGFTLRGDIYIIMKTVLIVFLGEGRFRREK